MRLDKYLANNTEWSRKEVKQLIRSGVIEIDGIKASSSSTHLSKAPKVTVEGVTIEPIGLGYFMLNKPTGTVCANSDATHATIFDLFDEPHSDLHVAGRLDIDTTGLVLVTNDGQWSHRITSPRHRCVKTYRVKTEEFMTQAMAKKLETGIFLEPESIRTAPAQVDLISEDEILLHITEGKHHQIKRMLHAVGNAVESLHRVSIGAIALDIDLLPGEYRPLTEEEVASA